VSFDHAKIRVTKFLRDEYDSSIDCNFSTFLNFGFNGCDPVSPLEFRTILPEFLQRAKNFIERRNEIVVFAPKSLQDEVN
jgi:hypothetical protein